MPTTPSHIVAIVNPATRGNVRRMVELLETAAPRSTTLEVHFTRHAGHARQLARENAAGADVLVAIGGDGTVAEVAGVARETGVPLGIVPGGSTNIIARELGIPTNSHLAARLIFGNHAIRSIDAGICGEHTFLHMAGAGVDSQLFDLANPALKRKVGWMAYVPAAIQALRRPLSTFTIESEEQVLTGVRSPLVLVANGPSIIAPRLQLDKRIRFDDGLLDVLVVTATTPTHLALVLARMAMRQMAQSPYVTAFTTRDVRISADPPIALQLDGDVSGTTPAQLSILPGAVQVAVPHAR